MNIDGKTDNGSKRNENDVREKVKALNVLNVYSNNLGLCVASEKMKIRLMKLLPFLKY